MLGETHPAGEQEAGYPRDLKDKVMNGTVGDREHCVEGFNPIWVAQCICRVDKSWVSLSGMKLLLL